MSIRKKEDDPLFVRGNIVKSSYYGYAILILGNGCYSSTTNGFLSKVWGVDLTPAILSRDIRHGTSYIVGNGRCVVHPTRRQRSELPLIFQYKILSTEKCFDQDGCLL